MGEDDDWRAVKGDRGFAASNLIALLGLVALWEHRGDDWSLKEDEPSLYAEIIEASLNRQRDQEQNDRLED